MIQKIQKFFHTETTWGKVTFITLTYLIFWCIFYGSLSLVSEDAFVGYGDFISFLLVFYVFILVPVLSFLLISYFKKHILIKYPYLLNIIFIILALILFFGIDLLKSMSHWFSF